MVAVAIYVVMNGKPLKNKDKEFVNNPECSGKLRELTKDELVKIKKSITVAMKYIKTYTGPSKIWFAYQNSLSEGCNRLSAIVSDLLVGKQTTNLLVDMLLRLDKKLCTGGVDDSNGIVGDFIQEMVFVLEEYSELDKNCISVFNKLIGKETCFGWEQPLVEIIDK